MISNEFNYDQIAELKGKLYEAQFHLNMNANWVNHLHGEIEFLKSQLRLSEEKCGRLEIELASQNMAFSQLQRDHQLLQSDHSLLKESSVLSSIDTFNSTIGSSVSNLATSSTSLFQPCRTNDIPNLSRAFSMDFLHPTSPPESTKKQSILQKALEIERKLKIAENDENNNEMSENCVSFRFFVGHLQAVHTEDVLMKFFSKFGHVVNVSIPLSSDKKPRGFAYVSFSELNNKNPLKIGNHLIAGKKVYVDISEPSKHHKDITKTLLVSGIIQDISYSSLKSYFEQFGKILEVIRHKESRRRYFHWAFVHFESEESSRKALEQKQHKINGNIVDIRCAQDFKPEKRGNVQEKNSLNVKKLLISNLNPKTNSSSLRSYFEKFGQVYDAYIPTFYGRNESKCYGYIVVNKDVPLEYENHTIDGNEVAIEIDNPARFKEQVKTLLVSASPETLEKITENSLRETFKKFGNIVSIRKPNDPKSKKSAHYAFVEYTSPNAVEEAIRKLAYKINGQIVCVSKARHDPKK